MPPRFRPGRGPHLRGKHPRRRRADRFIWVAAIAAAIAVAAIAFGYLREANDKEAEMQYLEQPADPQPATDTGAATPEQPITE